MNSLTRVGVLALATALLTARALAADSAAPTMQAALVDLDAPEAKPYRDTGDRAIDRLVYTMATDASRTVAGGKEVSALETFHLKDVPIKDGTVAGMPRITAMKLTSFKLRNPANAPDAAEQQALEAVKSGLDAGSPPNLLVQRVTLPGGATEWRVYKPLANIRQCGTCHAAPEAMSQELRAALAQKFPDDKAVGYQTGEWRGVIRVTVADPAPPSAPKPAPPAAPTKARRG